MKDTSREAGSVRRPLVVYAGQGIALADGFDLRGKLLTHLAGIPDVHAEDDLDAQIAVVRRDPPPGCTDEERDRIIGRLEKVLHTLDDICVQHVGTPPDLARWPTADGLCQRLSELARDRLVVLFTSNVDTALRYAALRHGARWVLPPSGLAHRDEIAGWLQEIEKRSPGFHYAPLHGEATLICIGDGGLIYATPEHSLHPLPIPDNGWHYTTGEGLGTNVRIIEDRLWLSKLAYPVFRRLIEGAGGADPADLLAVGYGAGATAVRAEQYGFEVSVHGATAAFASRPHQWLAVLPEGDAKSIAWYQAHGFRVVPVTASRSCIAALEQAVADLARRP